MKSKKIWIKERPAKTGKDPLKCEHAFVAVDSDAFPTCTKCGFNDMELNDLKDIQIRRVAKEVAKEYAEKVIMERERKALELEEERKRIIHEHFKDIEERESKKLKTTWTCPHSKTHLNSRGNPVCDSCGKLVKTTIHSKPLLIGRPVAMTGSTTPFPPPAFIAMFKTGDKVKIKDTHQIGEIRAVTPIIASKVGIVYSYDVSLYDGESKRYVGSRVCREYEIESFLGPLKKTPRKRPIANKTRKHSSKLIITDDEITFS